MSTATQTTPALKLAGLDASHFAYDGPPALPRGYAHDSIESLARSARARGLDQLWLHPSWHPTPDDAALWRETEYGMRLDPRQPAHWTMAYRPGMYGGSALVSVALDRNHVWDAAQDARTLVDAVSLYTRHMGTPYAYSPGATGTRLLRGMHGGAHALPIDLPGELPAPASEPRIECPIHWIRPLTPDERAAKYLHSYDKNGAWLGAAANLALGYGEPEHVVPPNMTADDLKLPGYFRVHLSERWQPVPAARLPLPPILPRPRRGSSLVWITQPMLALLREMDADMGITEAWVWSTTHKPLTPWQKRLRDARAALMADEAPAARIALGAVKMTYTHTLGRLGSKGTDGGLIGTDLYRPDWMQHNRALANANMHRQLWRMVTADGVYPFAVGGQDCFYVVSDEPDPIKAAPASLKLGGALGQWKVKDAGVPLGEVLAELERGAHADEYTGKLTRLQSWLKARGEA